MEQQVRKNFRKSLVALVLVTAVLLAGQGAPEQIAQIRHLASGETPYWLPKHAVLLYLWMPFLAVSACALILAPGLTLALATNKGASSFASVLLQAVAYTYLLVTVPAAAVGAVIGRAIVGWEFVALLFILTLGGLALVHRIRHDDGEIWQVFKGRGRDIAAAFLVASFAIVLLTPKFYWEDFNGDGAHLFLTARAFAHTNLPLWTDSLGNSVTYPLPVLQEVINTSWFIRFFGDHEIAARVPLCLGLGLLMLLLLEFVRSEGAKKPGWPVIISIGAALLLFAGVLAFQTSYNPYFADIVLPGTREPMILVFLLGFIYFVQNARFGWAMIMATALSFTVPSAPLLMAFWLGGVFLVWRPIPWKKLVLGALALVVALLVSKATQYVLTSSGLIQANAEFGAQGIARRLRYVAPFEVGRLLYWVLPCGIVPAVALFAWKWQDRLGRSLALLTIFYVLFFYVQAYRILPHHFTPAMVLPLVVFWRLKPAVRFQTAFAGVALVGIATAAFLSRPPDTRPHLSTRDFGETIALAGSAWTRFDPDDMTVASRLIQSAFPIGYSEKDRTEQYIVSPLAVYLYMDQTPSESAKYNYEIRKLTSPSRFESPLEISEFGEFGLYARNEDVYRADKTRSDVVRSIGNPYYYVPRDEIFGSGAQNDKRIVWDLARIAGLR